MHWIYIMELWRPVEGRFGGWGAYIALICRWLKPNSVQVFCMIPFSSLSIGPGFLHSPTLCRRVVPSSFLEKVVSAYNSEVQNPGDEEREEYSGSYYIIGRHHPFPSWSRPKRGVQADGNVSSMIYRDDEPSSRPYLK